MHAFFPPPLPPRPANPISPQLRTRSDNPGRQQAQGPHQASPFVSEEIWKVAAPQLSPLSRPKPRDFLYSTPATTDGPKPILSLLNGNGSSGSHLFHCLTLELVRGQCTGVHTAIAFLYWQGQLFNKVQQADPMILSSFIATYVLFAARRDQPEGFEGDISYVMRSLGVQNTYTVFSNILHMIREDERPLFLPQFLCSTLGQPVTFLQIMAYQIAKDSGCPPEMSVMRTILSIHESLGMVGPIWYSSMQALLLDLSFSTDICQPIHGEIWRRRAGFQQFCYVPSHRPRTPTTPRMPEHAESGASRE